MKNKIYLGLVLLLLPFFLTACTAENKTTKVGNNTSTQANENSNKGSNNTSSDTQDIKGSLLDLTKLGKNVTCTFEYQDDSGKSKGVTYVSGNKASSEFELVDTKGETINSYTISDGDWMYMWSSANDQGSKIKISEIESIKNNNSSPSEKTNYEGLKNDVDYKCKIWVPNDSKFSPPTNIIFTDMTDMINKFSDPQNLKNMCGMCNSLEGEEATQCKERLGCN